MSKFSMLTLAAFVTSDVANDRTGQHQMRLHMVQSAIDAALRGNATQYDSAVLAAVGKTQKAKAYRAGFDKVPRPVKFPYTGKLTANTAAQIAERADELTADWSEAFLAVMPLERATMPQEKKDELAEKRKAGFEAKAKQWAQDNGFVPHKEVDAMPRELKDFSPTALADVIVSIIHSGQLDTDNVQAVADACKAVLPAKQARKVRPIDPATGLTVHSTSEPATA